MKKNKTKPLLAFLHRNQISFYHESWAEVVTLAVPEEICKDLECVGKDDLCTLLSNFFKQNRIQPTEMVLVLSDNVTFSHELENLSENEAKVEEVKKFVQSVPFENKYFKELRFNKRSIVYVLNRNYYQPIVHCFHTAHFEAVALIPQLAIDESLQSTDLTPDLAKVIWEQLDTLKKNFNFLTEEKTVSSVRDISKPSHEREMILVGVFVLLLAVLGGVLFMTQRQNQTPTVTPSPVPAVRNVSPTPSTIPGGGASNTATSAATTSTPSPTQPPRSSLRIQVLNGSGQAGQAGNIQAALRQLGYSNIQIETTTVSGARTSMIVKSTIPTTYREEIVARVQTITGGEMSVQENNDIDVDILITTSRSE